MDDHKGQVIVSSEKQFVYHDSTNRGHVQLPRMLINCLKLSATAKIVYGVISGYVYEQGRKAFPSTSRIAMYAGISKKTAIKYIDELVDKGFILKKRHGNRRTNDYYLLDADKVNHLKVSEMFHSAFKTALQGTPDSGTEGLFILMDEILGSIEDLDFKEVPVDEKTEQALIATLVREAREDEDKGMFKPPNKSAPIPEAGVENSGKPLGGSVKKAGLAVSAGITRGQEEDVTLWKTDRFLDHFYGLFARATGRSHEVSKSKHRGMMARFVRNFEDDRPMAKKYIEAFFEIGYDNQSLEMFSTSGRMEELSIYLQTGKKPFYLDNNKKKKPSAAEVPEQSTSYMSPEDFLQRIKGGKR